jgi:SAM-dependent methyltransferase
VFGQVYRRLLSLCRFLGFEPKTLWLNLTRAPSFVMQLAQYQRLNTEPRFRAKFRYLWPILNESGKEAGIQDWVYFHQDLWAARKIYCRHPARHVDVGSRVDGFISQLLVFIPVCLVDIRPLTGEVTGLSVIRDDATELRTFETGSIESLSSLHAAEHFGLGRYSDPIDPGAWRRFMKSLQRVLAPNGRLYFSVPVGRQRVEFNAHRIFDIQTILDTFDALDLVSFSFVARNGRLHENVAPEQARGIEAGCGLFEFTKQSS